LNNELLLLLSLIITFSIVLLWHHLGGKNGLLCWLVLASILANIEVQGQIEAFGFQQTLGNILFASTFLATDALSEIYGAKEAKRAVYLAILGCLCYTVMSQFWIYFQPSASDFALPHLKVLAQSTPRVVLSGTIVFALVQWLDVWLYHFIWNNTTNGQPQLLWIRNNLSTILSQLTNAILFNVLAFYGTFPNSTLKDIILVNFSIFIVTSLLDTPFLYLIRNSHKKKEL